MPRLDSRLFSQLSFTQPVSRCPAPAWSIGQVCLATPRSRCISSQTETKAPLLTTTTLNTSISNTLPSLQASISRASAGPPQERVQEQISSPARDPLSLLPLSSILRTYTITTVSASPTLLSFTSSILQRMLNSRSILFNVDRNPLLRWILKTTFYAQFCAGENKAEVQRFIKDIEAVGYNGVCLEYAMEVLEDDNVQEANDLDKIISWKEGVMETIDMSKEGSFLAFKFSGMGSSAFNLLKANQPPSPPMAQALKEICDAALAKNVRLLPAAEPQNAQAAVDAWTLDLAKRYNSKNIPRPALIYNTYQCYLKSTPSTIASHIAIAEAEDFTLGAKLVRGAYMETEARGLIHDTKEDTDKCYDGSAEALMRREYNDVLQSSGKDSEKIEMPRVDIFLATHNLDSVKHAMRIGEEQQTSARSRGDNDKAILGEVTYAQLLGMADEVSCALLAAQKRTESGIAEPRVFKYCTWGTMTQCLNYLLRRAMENRDAMGRTKETAHAMRDELIRRMKKTMRLI